MFVTGCHLPTYYKAGFVWFFFFFLLPRTVKQNKCWELHLSMANTGIDLYHLKHLKSGSKSK